MTDNRPDSTQQWRVRVEFDSLGRRSWPGSDGGDGGIPQRLRAGRADGRYVEAELPTLPFADRSFDLALCSHLLFLYSVQLGEEFHRDSPRVVSLRERSGSSRCWLWAVSVSPSITVLRTFANQVTMCRSKASRMSFNGAPTRWCAFGQQRGRMANIRLHPTPPRRSRAAFQRG